MNARTILTAFLLMTTLAHAADDGLKDLIPADAKVEQLGTGMKFTEGPVWSDAEGKLLFSDIPASELKTWTKAGGVGTLLSETNQTNGNTFDREGRLLSCEHAGRRVAIVSMDGKRETLVDRSANLKKFNSPNDVVVKSDGTVWFTDPTYGLGRKPKEQSANHVFRFDPRSREARPVVSDFVQPNGLCFSPDEKTLYIADSGKPRHIRAFDVQPDNTLANDRVFCVIDKGVPDGIRCDEKGNVWSSAGDGVHVFAPDGKLLGKVAVPETPANLCFGGEDGKTLFITAQKSLYAVQTNVKGAARPR